MKLRRWDTKEVIFKLECSSWEELLKGALEAKISFYRADFRHSDFRHSNFKHSNFRHSDFSGSDFRDSDFRDSNFRHSNFRHSNFRDSDFSGSDFRHSNFKHSNFRDSDFRHSNFRDSDFSGSDFRDSDFSGSDFGGSDFGESKHQYKIGNMREWHSMQLDTYLIGFNEHILTIGCQQHYIEDWKKFNDRQISVMDDNALIWWNKWKEFIFKAIELCYE